jgi:hypothetical protein
MNRKLGATLFSINGPVLPHRADQLEAAYGVYKSKPENQAAVMNLMAGIDPETGSSLCGPTYGCSVNVPKRVSSNDASALLWVAGAMVAGGIARRRKMAR